MSYKITISESFVSWWSDQPKGLQRAVLSVLDLLKVKGPNLSRLYVESVESSVREGVIKEVGVSYGGSKFYLPFSFSPEQGKIFISVSYMEILKEEQITEQSVDKLYAEMNRKDLAIIQAATELEQIEQMIVSGLDREINDKDVMLFDRNRDYALKEIESWSRTTQQIKDAISQSV